MLDMSVRAKILELMLYLKRELDLTYLYITHDLATAKFFCDRIAILYLGRIVEIGPSDVIYEDPKHPYTKALLRAIPEPDPRRSVPRDLPRGEVPDAARPPRGCSFHPRCPLAFEVCGWEPRDLGDLLEARWALQPEVQYEAERAIVGDLSVLATADTSVRLQSSAKDGGQALARFLETVRADDPDNPFWKGVRQIVVADSHVDLEMFEPLAPRQLGVGTSQVECHLFDDDALEEARGAGARARARLTGVCDRRRRHGRSARPSRRSGASVSVLRRQIGVLDGLREELLARLARVDVTLGRIERGRCLRRDVEKSRLACVAGCGVGRCRVLERGERVGDDCPVCAWLELRVSG